MLTERTTTLFVSIFYFQKCQTRDSTFHYITVVKPFANTFSFCPIRVMHHCSTTRKMTPSSQSGHWISDGQSEPWRPAKT